jgi:hypothetical protein
LQQSYSTCTCTTLLCISTARTLPRSSKPQKKTLPRLHGISCLMQVSSSFASEMLGYSSTRLDYYRPCMSAVTFVPLTSLQPRGSHLLRHGPITKPAKRFSPSPINFSSPPINPSCGGSTLPWLTGCCKRPTGGLLAAEHIPAHAPPPIALKTL